ncbi:hypothetical protein PCANC_22672 [Puccinia coronata f. sp. avenae]|uniref:Uncharacterized protein n=1 Tax=Puccinia coronata f. sp. avenae TaxID=200324 RepID=A0A2N5TVK8_9BASI|nr:hypothetical protein PCANC_22672 [Puccinia coronata f. sp. avenae]
MTSYWQNRYRKPLPIMVDAGFHLIQLLCLPLCSYRQVIAAVTSKASQKINASLPVDGSSSALPADAVESPKSNQSAESLQSSSEASNINLPNELTVDADLSTCRLDSQGANLPSDSSHSVDVDAIKACLLSLAWSCLITVKASLLPSPDEMRLDPAPPPWQSSQALRNTTNLESLLYPKGPTVHPTTTDPLAKNYAHEQQQQPGSFSCRWIPLHKIL